MRPGGITMLLAVVCGITIAIVGKALLQQWLTGVLSEAPRPAHLSPVEFPHLAPPARPARTRPVAPQTAVYLRRAA